MEYYSLFVRDPEGASEGSLVVGRAPVLDAMAKNGERTRISWPRLATYDLDAEAACCNGNGSRLCGVSDFRKFFPPEAKGHRALPDQMAFVPKFISPSRWNGFALPEMGCAVFDQAIANELLRELPEVTIRRLSDSELYMLASDPHEIVIQHVYEIIDGLWQYESAKHQIVTGFEMLESLHSDAALSGLPCFSAYGSWSFFYERSIVELLVRRVPNFESRYEILNYKESREKWMNTRLVKMIMSRK